MLQALSEKKGITTFNPAVFQEAGLVSKNDKVKILGNGELTAAIEVTADAFSKSAVEAIEAAKGTVVKL